MSLFSTLQVFPSPRVGTADSGKPQLALAEYQAAIDAGLRQLFVCFNRPLADHIERLVPPGGRVSTFHMMCDAYMRVQDVTPDYSSPEVWNDIETALAEVTLPETWQFDVLIVDEGQDFSLAWRDILLGMLKPGGRAIWLEDPDQNLYGRQMVPLPVWVTALRHQLPQPAPDRADAQLTQTRRAVTTCLAAGFGRHDIAICSFPGREKSAILNLGKLSDAHTLRSFAGEYVCSAIRRSAR